MWNLTQCNGLHGHIKVAPDGTVYVPNKNCGGQQAVAVSEDNGLTWNIRKVPGSSGGTTDPSVGSAATARCTSDSSTATAPRVPPFRTTAA
jgi:hypothetical protein